MGWDRRRSIWVSDGRLGQFELSSSPGIIAQDGLYSVSLWSDHCKCQVGNETGAEEIGY